MLSNVGGIFSPGGGSNHRAGYSYYDHKRRLGRHQVSPEEAEKKTERYKKIKKYEKMVADYSKDNDLQPVSVDNRREVNGDIIAGRFMNVGEGAHIKGNVLIANDPDCENLPNDDFMDGNGVLVIKKGAVVDGDIWFENDPKRKKSFIIGKVIIEPGAQVNGEIIDGYVVTNKPVLDVHKRYVEYQISDKKPKRHLFSRSHAEPKSDVKHI